MIGKRTDFNALQTRFLQLTNSTIENLLNFQTIMYSQPTSHYYLPQGFIPNETDILCGRGKAHAKHPGNIVFMEEIRASLKEYTNAGSRIEKSVMVTSVVNAIIDAGMRFLKYDTQFNQYVELSSDRAYQKVGHAIRDLIKQTKKSSKSKEDATKLARGKKIVPNMVHSVGETIVSKRAELSKCEKNSPLSSSSVKQQQEQEQQQLPKSLFSLGEQSGELGNALYDLSENFCSGAKYENLLTILTEDIISLEFDSADAISKQQSSNVVSPLPLDSKLDFEYLDIETLSGILGMDHL
jgi:hypothetical protein